MILKIHTWFLSTFIASVPALTACSKSGGSVDAGPVEKVLRPLNPR